MLNRTNRTLSANLNRLNLGTRSLVVKANEINGKSALDSRHAHDFAQRDGMMWSFDPSIRSSSRIAISVIPGSSPVVPWPVVVASVVPPEVVLHDVPDAPRLRTASAACFSQAEQRQGSRQRPARPGYKTGQSGKLRQANAAGAARVRTTSSPALATTAAAGG